MLIRRKCRCGVFAGNCVIHIWALSGRVTDDRRYTSPTSFPFLSFMSQGGFCKISHSCQRNVTIFLVTLSLNNLGFGDKWRRHYIYVRFFVTGLYELWTLIHPASPMHRATCWRQECLSWADASTSSQVNPILWRSFFTTSLQFILGLSGLLNPATSQCSECFGMRTSSILVTWLSHRILIRITFSRSICPVLFRTFPFPHSTGLSHEASLTDATAWIFVTFVRWPHSFGWCHHYLFVLQCESKKQDTLHMSINSRKINRFSRLCHWQTQN